MNQTELINAIADVVKPFFVRVDGERLVFVVNPDFIRKVADTEETINALIEIKQERESAKLEYAKKLDALRKAEEEVQAQCPHTLKGLYLDGVGVPYHQCRACGAKL